MLHNVKTSWSRPKGRARIIALAVLLVAIVAPTTYWVAENFEKLTAPFVSVYEGLGPSGQTWVTLAAEWGSAALLGITIWIIYDRYLTGQPASRGLTIVDGGNHLQWLERHLQGMGKKLRGKVQLAGVLPVNGAPGNRAIRVRRWWSPLRLELWGVRPGEKPGPTRNLHEGAARDYHEPIVKFADATQRVVIHASIDGLTNANVVNQLHSAFTNKQVFGIVNGRAPTQLVEALNSQFLYQEARDRLAAARDDRGESSDPAPLVAVVP